MHQASETSAPQPRPGDWLAENGPKELELLFRAIVYHPAAPILIADNDRNSRDASAGAGRLLGVPRAGIVGRKLDDFAQPDCKTALPQIWRELLDKGEHEGTLQFENPDGSHHSVTYKGRTNVLPVRHVLTLHNPKTAAAGEHIQSSVEDYALLLLDPSGLVVEWYSGAARIYGYAQHEILGRETALLIASKTPDDELNKAAAAGHFGNEAWQLRKNGTKFWGNIVTMALRDETGELHGFARVVRDFTDRHKRDENLRRERARVFPAPAESAIAGIVSGEYDRTPEVNDAFLDIVGYTREDLLAGRLQWLDLTPPEYFPLDELAHEEGLRFGACTPFEKELFRKDGTRVPVLIATAVLKLSPFRWIAFIQDLRKRDRVETVSEPVSEHNAAIAARFTEMVGGSPALRRVQQLIEVVAPTDATVLILGETGTGKELIAHAVHRLSPRRGLPFISLNCAAIPTGLLESELFGYERGAFTGALGQKIGRFEMAHRGTLFLDEVGDIPLDLQPKLLRALQEKSFERLGGTRTIPIDVRLVAATNRNLTQMMGDKLFRTDLYYRLKVFPITTPALRDHPEDIPLLVRHFTRKYAAKLNREIVRIPAHTMTGLVAWSWPGNVRELENFIERSVILSTGSVLLAPLSELRDHAPEADTSSLLVDIERDHILRMLRESGGVVSVAANRLGIPRTTLNAMMKKLGVSRGDI